MAAQALTATHDPAQRLAIITETIARLSRDCGVTVQYVTWPGRELADWHSATRTFYIAADATLAHQVWAFKELELLLAVGPHACAGGHKTPILHVVPEPSSN